MRVALPVVGEGDGIDGGTAGGLVPVGAGGCNRLVIAWFWSKFAADRDPVIAGVVVLPDEVLAKELELKVDGLASRADEGRVVAVVGATVADASPWRVGDDFTTVSPLIRWDPVEGTIASAPLEAAAIFFVTSDCAVGVEGAGFTIATPGRFVSLW